MAIAFDSSGSATGNGISTLTLDITSATTGAWCWCFIGMSAQQSGTTTFTGWTSILDADVGVEAHYALFRRKKVGGDTTFSPSWPVAEGSSLAWVSYTGCHATAPDEGSAEADVSTSTSAWVSPTVTPSGTNRWALTAAFAKSTNSANQPNAFTAGSGITLRKSVTNTANAWAILGVSDSNGTVTQAAHSYTQNSTHAEGDGWTELTYLVPAAAGATLAVPNVFVNQAVRRASVY